MLPCWLLLPLAGWVSCPNNPAHPHQAPATPAEALTPSAQPPTSLLPAALILSNDKGTRSLKPYNPSWNIPAFIMTKKKRQCLTQASRCARAAPGDVPNVSCAWPKEVTKVDFSHSDVDSVPSWLSSRQAKRQIAASLFISCKSPSLGIWVPLGGCCRSWERDHLLVSTFCLLNTAQLPHARSPAWLRCCSTSKETWWWAWIYLLQAHGGQGLCACPGAAGGAGGPCKQEPEQCSVLVS